MGKERRFYPRVSVDIPAELDMAMLTETLDVRVTNLSLAGLMIEGDQRVYELKPPAGIGSVEIGLHFGIQGQPVHCHCRVVYKRRAGQNRCALGLAILSISESQKALIARLVDKIQAESI